MSDLVLSLFSEIFALINLYVVYSFYGVCVVAVVVVVVDIAGVYEPIRRAAHITLNKFKKQLVPDDITSAKYNVVRVVKNSNNKYSNKMKRETSICISPINEKNTRRYVCNTCDIVRSGTYVVYLIHLCKTHAHKQYLKLL